MQTDTNQPVISVIMGTYYRKESTFLLKRSVDSILSQTERRIEFLICDDGSTPDAARLLNDYREADPRIRLIRPGDRMSLPEKLNACLNQTKGIYIARMDDDDYAHRDRFEKQILALERNPGIAFVGTNVNVVRGGKQVGKKVLPQNPEGEDFFLVQPYIHPTLMFRREVLAVSGGYSEDRHCVLCEDYDLLMRLYAKGYRGMNLQEELLDYTVPMTARGNRRMKHRWNETVTRWNRFRECGLMPKGLPYVVKPLAVGLIPESLLKRIKNRQYDGREPQR